ncbi:hypothetical protein SAMN04488057_12523 [Cyclobacterium lianum]|uniref:Uncharacterized protein n=1 Tax=Cyclobacterium lianum TaxID=388280 RepID=A0A1M7QU73_9BACT|nr:hypothetical protein SAMN04488057_12523 [Cyclobacterium lianum]
MKWTIGYFYPIFFYLRMRLTLFHPDTSFLNYKRLIAKYKWGNFNNKMAVLKVSKKPILKNPIIINIRKFTIN